MEPEETKSSVGAKRLHSTSTERAAHLAAWERSGKSAADYAHAHGLHARNLYAWRSKRTKSGSPASAFVPVRIGPESWAAESGLRITLKADGVEWVIEGATNPEGLVSLAGALKREVFDV